MLPQHARLVQRGTAGVQLGGDAGEMRVADDGVAVREELRRRARKAAAVEEFEAAIACVAAASRTQRALRLRRRHAALQLDAAELT